MALIFVVMALNGLAATVDMTCDENSSADICRLSEELP